MRVMDFKLDSQTQLLQSVMKVNKTFLKFRIWRVHSHNSILSTGEWEWVLIFLCQEVLTEFTVKLLFFCSSHIIIWSLRKLGVVVFWVDVPSNRAAIECIERLTFSSLFLPHHLLVIMKAESLVRRQIVNAETDR